MFRNESEEVTRKAKAKAKAKATTQNGIQRLSVESTTPNLTCPPSTAAAKDVRTSSELGPLSYSHNLAPTIDERAMGYFFSNYVVGTDGLWDHILDENMTSSIKALGLAGFSHAARAPKLMIEAREQYLRAIRLTTAALKSPRDVKKDSTLLSIMILGMFETVTGRTQRSIEAWAHHVNGAAALLKIRGPEQMITPAGRRMFAQVTSSLVTTCLQHQLEVPEHIQELRNEGVKFQPTSDPIWQFFEIMILFTNFKAYVDHGKISDFHTVLARALELDGMFVSLCTNVPPGWEYQTIYTNADPDIIYAGYYHVYRDFMIAQIWNGIRTFRILLHEIVRGALLAQSQSFSKYQEERNCAVQHWYTTVSPDESNFDTLTNPSSLNIDYGSNNGAALSVQFQKSMSTTYRLQSDILASIPQYIGYASKPDASPSSFQRSLWSNFGSQHPYPLAAPGSSSSSSHLPLIRMSEGYALLWPLYTAGITNIATEPVQRWVAEMLCKIGRAMGTQQAFVLSDMLEQRIAMNRKQEAPVCSTPELSETETEIDLAGQF
ncbi:hypothetical protein MMC26_005389 [Xylographa opegraphella]|nr:hypothetical protein [Xylographa opegraphella]